MFEAKNEIMPEKLQEEFRAKYVKDAKENAWRTFVQVAFLQGEFNGNIEQLTKIRKGIAKLEAEIKEIEGHSPLTREDREEIKKRNIELGQMRPIVEPLQKNMQEASSMIGSKMDEGERYLKIAGFATTYHWEQPKPAPVEPEKKADEVKAE